ncbi:MAG: PilZ domain-containing protein [Polyangiaceae bacterium]|nr:PilZ domain-containing protein [Polyangiaceae bacterium]
MTDESTDQEVRLSDRVTINKEFESFDAFINEYVTNISRSGVYIRSKIPLAVGTEVDLRFSIIMDEIETLEGKGEVVRVDETGMGVVFRSLTGYSKNLIERLLVQRA